MLVEKGFEGVTSSMASKEDLMKAMDELRLEVSAIKEEMKKNFEQQAAKHNEQVDWYH